MHKTKKISSVIRIIYLNSLWKVNKIMFKTEPKQVFEQSPFYFQKVYDSSKYR